MSMRISEIDFSQLLDVRVDYLFKLIFGEDVPRLISLLNAIFANKRIDRVVTDVMFRPLPVALRAPYRGRNITPFLRLCLNTPFRTIIRAREIFKKRDNCKIHGSAGVYAGVFRKMRSE